MTSATLPQLPALTARRSDIGTVFRMLQDQQARKVDIVLPAKQLVFGGGGSLAVNGLEPMISEDGVLDPSGLYRPTGPVDNQLSSLLDIPARYVRKLRDEIPGLLDTNLNELASRVEDKKVLVRLLWGSDPEHPDTNGVVRAILSDKYKTHDNLDTLIAVLNGMKEAGLSASNIRSVDLSDNRLYLSVHSPEVQTLASDFLKGYRSPFNGASGDDLPVVFAGFVFSNSEVGDGAFTIDPQVVVQVCTNGMTIRADNRRFRKIHLGSKLEEGVVDWSAETREAQDALVKAQVKDAVQTYLSQEFLEESVEILTEKAGVELDKPEETIKVVTKECKYSKAEAEGLLSHFIQGGQITSGGIAQAVTSFSQTIENADRAHAFNDTAIKAMEVAAAYATR